MKKKVIDCGRDEYTRDVVGRKVKLSDWHATDPRDNRHKSIYAEYEVTGKNGSIVSGSAKNLTEAGRKADRAASSPGSSRLPVIVFVVVVAVVAILISLYNSGLVG